MTMNIQHRRGDWMQTHSGKQFWPFDPHIEDIDINDIARALSKQCRFAGHCLRFYSVAEHSVLVWRLAPQHLKLTALLHDASEAYLVDIPRPVKPYLQGYEAIEQTIMMMISEKFGAIWPLPREVKQLDNALLHDEKLQNMAPQPSPWVLPEPPSGTRLEFWDPERAAQEFIAAFNTIGDE